MKLFFGFYLFISAFCTAETINLSAAIDRKSVPINGSFIISFSIEFDGKSPEVFIPNLTSSDFEVLSRWTERQNSVSITNGQKQTSYYLNYKYRLQPKAKGRLRIESRNIQINGKSYKTQEFFINVTEEDKNFSTNPLNQPFGLPNTPINRFFEDDPFKSISNSLNKSFFSRAEGLKSSKIQTKVQKKAVYKGEALKVDWILSLATGIRYEIDKRPKLENFWKEEILKNQQSKFLNSVIVNGARYQKILFDSMVLFPLKEGNLSIDSYSVNLVGLLASRSQKKKSNAVSISVKPLPQDPKNVFSGAVGTFTVIGSLKSNSGKVNEPVSFTLFFEGDGHPQFVQFPKINFPDSLKVYDPAEESQFDSLGKSFKNYEVILIPKQEGVITIPEFEVSTFNPKTGKYDYHKIPSFNLNVYKGDQEISDSANFFDEESKQIEDDKAEDASFLPIFFSHKSFKFVWMIFVFIFFGSFGYYLFLAFKNRSKTIAEKFEESFKQIESLIQQEQWQQASVEITNLCYLTFHQLDIKSDSEDWLSLVKSLPPSLYQQYGSELEELMQKLEYLSFGPQHLSHQEGLEQVKNLQQKARNLLANLVLKK